MTWWDVSFHHIHIWPRNAVIFALISHSSGLMGWVTRRHRTAETETREPEKKRSFAESIVRIEREWMLGAFFHRSSWSPLECARARQTARKERSFAFGRLASVARWLASYMWKTHWTLLREVNLCQWKQKLSEEEILAKEIELEWNVKCFAICRVSLARHNKQTCTQHRSVIIAEQGSRTSVVYKRKRKVNFTLIEILD